MPAKKGNYNLADHPTDPPMDHQHTDPHTGYFKTFVPASELKRNKRTTLPRRNRKAPKAAGAAPDLIRVMACSSGWYSLALTIL